jgi:HEAT repeat protein
MPDAPVDAMLEELRAAGVDTDSFGIFFRLPSVDFDYRRAAPILLRWLPEIEDNRVREAIARSLTGEPEARRIGAASILVAEFARSSDSFATRWAIGNALATLADAAVADDVIHLLRDHRYGTARQMLCEALKRTGDSRTGAVLIEMLDDDDVAGHAVAALRSLGPKRSLPLLREARPKLEMLAERQTATPLARKQASLALARLGAADA